MASKHLTQQLEFSLTTALRGRDFPHAQRLTKVAEAKALSGRTGDPRVLIPRQPEQTLFHSRNCPVEQSGEGCCYHAVCSSL